MLQQDGHLFEFELRIVSDAPVLRSYLCLVNLSFSSASQKFASPHRKSPGEGFGDPAITTALVLPVPPATPLTTPRGTRRPSIDPKTNCLMRPRFSTRSFSPRI